MVVLCQSRQICLFTLDCITTDRNQRSAERLSFNIIIVVVTDLHIKYSRCRTTCSCNGKYCCHRSIQKSYLPKWGNVYREQTGYLTAQRVSLANHVMAHPSLAKRSEIVRNCTEMAKFLSAYILHIFVYYMYPRMCYFAKKYSDFICIYFCVRYVCRNPWVAAMFSGHLLAVSFLLNQMFWKQCALRQYRSDLSDQSALEVRVRIWVRLRVALF